MKANKPWTRWDQQSYDSTLETMSLTSTARKTYFEMLAETFPNDERVIALVAIGCLVGNEYARKARRFIKEAD